MKYILISTLVAFTVSCNAETKKTLPVNKAETVVKADQAKTETKKEEDCDDKAKKPIEIKEETISLSGNTGCSLDEVKP